MSIHPLQKKAGLFRIIPTLNIQISVGIKKRLPPSKRRALCEKTWFSADDGINLEKSSLDLEKEESSFMQACYRITSHLLDSDMLFHKHKSHVCLGGECPDLCAILDCFTVKVSTKKSFIGSINFCAPLSLYRMTFHFTVESHWDKSESPVRVSQ